MAHLVSPQEPALVRLLKNWITKCDFIHPHKDLVRGKMIQNLHDQGFWVNVWTVNEPGLILSMLLKGVDGIITDDPELAGRLVGK
jgi:glycerophosphoryl diester phosphodiesterase